jgi:exopolysaccharide biosynthesis WecB/TagA/CpsF family protein
LHSISLLEKVRVFGNGKDCIDCLNSVRASPAIVSFLNAHAFNLSCRNPAFYSALMASEIVLRDGIGTELIMQAAALKAGVNTNGTDLIPAVLQSRPGARVAVIGTREPWLSAACARIEEFGANVVLRIDGFKDVGAYVEEVACAAPDIILLGMGMPKQEFVAVELVKHLDRHPCLILNGGAILDFLADRFPRAPEGLRRFRMEWLFRLLLEPRRLWRRYIVGGVIFSTKIVQVAWVSRLNLRAKVSGSSEIASSNPDHANSNSRGQGRGIEPGKSEAA